MKHYIATAFAASALLAAPAWAQDMPSEEPEDSAPPAQIQDKGEAIVSESQQKPAEPAPVELTESAREVVERMTLDARDKALEAAEDGVVFVIGKARGTCPNPVGSKAFIKAKRILSMIAYLDAKRQIAEAFYSNVSASLASATVGTEESADDEVVAAKAAIADKTAKLADLVRMLDEKEADRLAGCSVADMAAGALEGVVKRINPQFSKDAVDAEKAENIARIQDAIKEVRAELAEFEKIAEAAQERIQAKYTSKFEQTSHMHIYGAKIIYQADSWNKADGDYEVACAVVFSPKLQEQACLALMGKQEKREGFENNPTASRWVTQNRELLQTWVGARQIIDKNGRLQIVGIGIADADVPNAERDKQELFAETSAKMNAIFGLYSEVASDIATEENLVKKDDDTFSEKEMDKAMKAMESKFKRDFSGLKPIGTTHKVIEKRSGKPVFISVYTIDPATSKCANAVLESSTVLANLGEIASQRKRGLKDGLDASHEAVKRSTVEYDKAKAGAKASADANTAAKDAAVNGIKVQGGGTQGGGKTRARGGEAIEGVISGGDVDMDW